MADQKFSCEIVFGKRFFSGRTLWRKMLDAGFSQHCWRGQDGKKYVVAIESAGWRILGFIKGY